MQTSPGVAAECMEEIASGLIGDTPFVCLENPNLVAAVRILKLMKVSAPLELKLRRL